MKVYLVSAGSYSDFRIIGIFSTLEQAEAFRIQYDKSAEFTFEESNDIDEWDVDVPPDRWVAYEVVMQKDGTLGESPRKREVATDHVSVVYFWAGDRMMTRVITDSEERAIKVANERRTAILAAGTWGKNQESYAGKEGD